MPFRSSSTKQPETITAQQCLSVPGRGSKIKKFEIKNTRPGQWLVLHNEVPKFTCLFENKRFSYQRTITGLTDPTGDPKELQLLQKMEQWLKRYHKDKIDQ